MTLPDEQRGAEALRGAWFAVAGDDKILDVVRSLGGRSFTVADERRALYHAAACVAANHLVALMGQVERLADAAGVPLRKGTLATVDVGMEPAGISGTLRWLVPPDLLEAG